MIQSRPASRLDRSSRLLLFLVTSVDLLLETELPLGRPDLEGPDPPSDDLLNGERIQYPRPEKTHGGGLGWAI